MQKLQSKRARRIAAGVYPVEWKLRVEKGFKGRFKAIAVLMGDPKGNISDLARRVLAAFCNEKESEFAEKTEALKRPGMDRAKMVLQAPREKVPSGRSQNTKGQ